MKILKNILLTTGLSALLGGLLVAQELKEVANIPFTYQVGRDTMAAGKYMVAEGTSRSIFRLSEQASGHSMFVSATPENASRNGESKLVFSCYAGQCSLREIWIDGNSYKLTAKPLPREAKNELGVVALISVPLLSR